MWWQMQVTPLKGMKVGDRVFVRGHEEHGERRIASLYDQVKIPGGVKLDKAVDLFHSWNEDALDIVDDETSRAADRDV